MFGTRTDGLPKVISVHLGSPGRLLFDGLKLRKQTLGVCKFSVSELDPLIIAIPRYGEFPAIKTSAVDGKDFAAWLLDPSGGELPPQNVLVFTDETEGVGPTRTRMLTRA